jgi:hypothetical protein
VCDASVEERGGRRGRGGPSVSPAGRRTRQDCSNKSVYLKKRPAGQLASEPAQRGWVRTDSEGTRGHDVGGTGRGGPRRILWAQASRQVAAGRGRSRRMEGGGHGVKSKDLFSKRGREGPVRDPLGSGKNRPESIGGRQDREGRSSFSGPGEDAAPCTHSLRSPSPSLLPRVLRDGAAPALQ